jgi:hypothetical protein
MNIEKKYGVMIATPCYGGQLTEAYLHGILSTTVKAQQKGISTTKRNTSAFKYYG